jgi:Rha family phage regulatory protein
MKNLVTIQNGQPVTSSLLVAEIFEKRNADVLRDIRNLHCSKEFHRRHFSSMVEMRDLPQGGATKTQHYVMTKDGFTFLVMGYTGEKAGKFKERYINAFNKMEEIIRDGIALRVSAVEENIKRRYLLTKELQEVNAQITALMKRHKSITKEMREIDNEDFAQLSLFPKCETHTFNSAFPNRAKALK